MTETQPRPRSNAETFFWGAVIGGVLGAGWVLARRYGHTRSDELFDWDQITAVALRTGARGVPMSDSIRRETEGDYAAVLREVSGPLEAYTGTGLDLSRTEVRVLDRSDWVRANVANFRHMFEPLEKTWIESAREGRAGLGSMAGLGRAAISGEMGILLGYLARRVLGQYDITLLSHETAEPGKLYFVEPNVQNVQLKLGLPRREFRTWLTLHEATHAHEFEGYPWIRQYMDDLLQKYLKSMLEQLLEGKAMALSSLSTAADRLLRGDSFIEAAMTPLQRDLFLKLQAFMSLMEGYATHLMSAVGEGLVPHFQEIEQRVEARQHQRSALELLFLRLTGLHLKFEQYRLGTAFVAQVEKARGKEFLHKVWTGPEHLPTMDEIGHPQRWIERIETAATPAA